MASQNADLTIDELLMDPLIHAVMKADRVDPREFQSMLLSFADSGRVRRKGHAGVLASKTGGIEEHSEGLPSHHPRTSREDACTAKMLKSACEAAAAQARRAAREVGGA